METTRYTRLDWYVEAPIIRDGKRLSGYEDDTGIMYTQAEAIRVCAGRKDGSRPRKMSNDEYERRKRH